MSSSVTLRAAFALLLSTLALSFGLTGCGKPDSPDSAAAPSTLNSQPSTPVLRFHWLGRDRLATEANATNFMAIWNLPESAALQNQTLAKLATAPWRLWQTNVAVSNAPTAQLRPLLDDLVHRETYLEVVEGTNASWQAVLALRLPADRAALWQSNLPMILRSLYPDFGSDSTPNSYLLTSNSSLAIIRSNDWTLISFSAPTQPSTLNPQPDSTLLTTFLSRLATHATPYAPRATNYWVEIDFNPAEFPAFRKRFPALSLTNVSLAAYGDGENVRTLGNLSFSTDLPVSPKAWDIPTNIISDPIVSLTAVQGLRSWRQTLGFSGQIFGADLPEEVYAWSLPNIPVLTYLAAPAPAASQQLLRLSQQAVTQGNQWLETNSVGAFAATPDGGLSWRGFPFGSPFLKVASDHGSSYLVGGMMPMGSTNRPMSPALIAGVFTRTNMIYYNWEVSERRVEAWFYLGQLFRVVFQKAQLPRDSAGLLWLNAIAPKLTTAATVATVENSQEIEIVRRSTVGLTALELHGLIDWLESPGFPRGLHTQLVIPEKVLLRHGGNK